MIEGMNTFIPKVQLTVLNYAFWGYKENRPFPSCVKILWIDIPEHLSVNLESIQKRAV